MLLKSIHHALIRYLAIFIRTSIITGFDDHVHDEAFFHFIKLRDGQTHLFCTEHIDGGIYFPVGRETPFLGVDVVCREPRYMETKSFM